MARDETLVEVYAASGAPRPPTLRLYSWDPPALSLGCRQPARGSHDPVFLRGEGIDLVRRPTGGRAVLHEHERTYSVVGCVRLEPFVGGVLDTYRRIASAIVVALRGIGVDAVSKCESRAARDPGPLGPPICFDVAAAHEITAGGRKVVGSAQLRRRGAFLQHGSILLRADPGRLERAVGAARSERRFAGLEAILARRPEREELDRAIIAAFQETFDSEMRPGVLSPEEERLAERLRAGKYATRSWTLDGKVEFRATGFERS